MSPHGLTQNRTRPRVAVIGGGIFGLAHAWAAARRGWQVLLFERDRPARGASVRNFGMVWPIGQANGPAYRAAMKSRELWLAVLRESGLPGRSCGSLHLAYREDELAVLAEFAQLAPELGYDCRLLNIADAVAKSPAIKREGLLGALWSPTEVSVDPREIVSRLPGFLRDAYGVELHYGTSIDRISSRWVASAAHDRWTVDRVVVAAGADFQLLYPDLSLQAGFRRCKLQMLRTAAQPSGWRMGPMLAGGLTLRHYEAFRVCRSLAELKDRISHESPELDAYGIHVMAAQNDLGEVVLGDSHEYDEQATPFDKTEIDELILRELRKMLTLPDWTISQRWHGVYLKAPEMTQYAAEIDDGVGIRISSGGAGMTLSWGLADEAWTRWHAGETAERSEDVRTGPTGDDSRHASQASPPVAANSRAGATAHSPAE